MHHRQDGIQLTAVPKVTQQLNPLFHIQGITEQTLAGDGITSNSLHQIGSKAVVFQLRHDPLPHQLTEVVVQLAGIHLKGREKGSPLRHGVIEERHEVKAPSHAPENLHNTIAGPPQGIGVGGSCRPLSLSKDAEEQLKPFRQGHNCSCKGCGQGITGAPGQIVLHHSESDIAGFSLLQEVFAPHQALKFRELAHHLADQIVLAEMSGTLGRIRHALIKIELLQQQPREPLDPLGAVEKTAQPFSEGDAIKGFTPRCAGLTSVNVQEKFSIRQARSKHAFIATND